MSSRSAEAGWRGGGRGAETNVVSFDTRFSVKIGERLSLVNSVVSGQWERSVERNNPIGRSLAEQTPRRALISVHEPDVIRNQSPWVFVFLWGATMILANLTWVQRVKRRRTVRSIAAQRNRAVSFADVNRSRYRANSLRKTARTATPTRLACDFAMPARWAALAAPVLTRDRYDYLSPRLSTRNASLAVIVTN